MICVFWNSCCLSCLPFSHGFVLVYVATNTFGFMIVGLGWVEPGSGLGFWFLSHDSQSIKMMVGFNCRIV